MFGAEPDLGRLNLPAEIEFTENRKRIHEADAVVFHIPSLDWYFFRRKKHGQAWVAWSMECEQHYARLRSARFMKQFDLNMSYHLDADVMTSYLPDELVNRGNLPEAPGQHQHLCCSFVSGWADRSGRTGYLNKLAQGLDIHQYGRCGNRTIANDQGRQSKLATCAQYKFTLAFENAIAPDYVTEKLYDPLVAGSVPVYLGAPNVAQFAPRDGSYINAADFPGPQELTAYLLELDADEQAYARYMDWREQPYSDEFSALCRRNNKHSMERLCELLLAM
jgi:hypothetical protein